PPPPCARHSLLPTDRARERPAPVQATPRRGNPDPSAAAACGAALAPVRRAVPATRHNEGAPPHCADRRQPLCPIRRAPHTVGRPVRGDNRDPDADGCGNGGPAAPASSAHPPLPPPPRCAPVAAALRQRSTAQAPYRSTLVSASPCGTWPLHPAL